MPDWYFHDKAFEVDLKARRSFMRSPSKEFKAGKKDLAFKRKGERQDAKDRLEEATDHKRKTFFKMLLTDVMK